MALAAALNWWREAGVDHAFHDEPQAWLAEIEAEVEVVAPVFAAAPRQADAPPRVRIGGERSLWPQTLADFAQWWLEEPSLDGGQTGSRITPRGSAGAELMILVEQPEAEDGDRLLSGPQGRLLSAMLTAMGIAPEKAYIASVLPRHTPAADWAELQADGMHEVLAHHITLAAPQRLICFGSNILPLIGHDPANSPEILREFNHGNGSVPSIAEKGLSWMLSRPRAKATFWRRWLDWTQV